MQRMIKYVLFLAVNIGISSQEECETEFDCPNTQPKCCFKTNGDGLTSEVNTCMTWDESEYGATIQPQDDNVDDFEGYWNCLKECTGHWDCIDGSEYDLESCAQLTINGEPDDHRQCVPQTFCSQNFTYEIELTNESITASCKIYLADDEKDWYDDQDLLPEPPDPPQIEYVLQGEDFCHKYSVPPWQEFPIIQDYKLNYYTSDANFEIYAEYEMLEGPKLPVMCLYCNLDYEYDEQDQNYDIWERQFWEQDFLYDGFYHTSQFIMYFGTSVMEGSALCYKIGWTEQSACEDADTPSYACDEDKQYQEILTYSAVAEDFLPSDGMLDLQYEIESLSEDFYNWVEYGDWKDIVTAAYPQSKIISILNVDIAHFEQLMATNINSHIFEQLIDIQLGDIVGYEGQHIDELVDLQYNRIILAQDAFDEYLCIDYTQDHRDHVLYNLEQDGKTRLMQATKTIYNLGWGCNICDTCSGFNYVWPCDYEHDYTYTPKLKALDDDYWEILVSKLDVHGYTNYGMDFPTYDQLKQEGIVLIRSCEIFQTDNKISEVDYQIAGSNTFTSIIDWFHDGELWTEDRVGYYEVNHYQMPCYIWNNNCALCSQIYPYECLICINGYARAIYNSDSSIPSETKEKTACFRKFCQPGNKMITNFNGIAYCETCQVDNCLNCGQIFIEIPEVEEDQESQQSTDDNNTFSNIVDDQDQQFIEICLKCIPPYIQNNNRTQCISLEDYFAQDLDTVQQPINLVRDYIIKSNEGLDPQSLTSEDISELIENENISSTTSIFYFIQSVLNGMNYELALYSETIQMTIWLNKGSHYWFYCEETLDIEKIDSPLKHDILCALPSLRMFQPQTDNIHLTIKPIKCYDEESQMLVTRAIGGINQEWFDDNCVNVDEDIVGKQENGEVYIDERPIIYVSQSDHYFNITNKATFEDVIFDGINQFAQMKYSNSNFEDTEDQETEDIVFRTPYLTIQKCQLNPTASEISSSEKYTPLLNAMFSHENEPETDYGYGYLHMKPVSEQQFIDEDSGDLYDLECEYLGTKHNLYNIGANQVMEDLMTHKINEEANVDHVYQDFVNYFISSNNDYKQNETSGESYPTRKRQTLFNLYAFTLQDSFQKNHTQTEEEEEIEINPYNIDWDNYHMPTLELKNVEIRNMLYDYQSLIYVEKDNYIIRSNYFDDVDGPEISIFHYGNYKADANIQIINSNIIDCSFSQGMIFVPPMNFIHTSYIHTIYRYQNNMLEKWAVLEPQMLEVNKISSQILLADSVFSNLNYGQYVSGLVNKLKTADNLLNSASKGIVLSVHQFEGQIQLMGNKIRHNMVFVPSAIFTNFKRPKNDDYYFQEQFEYQPVFEVFDESNKNFFGQSLLFSIEATSDLFTFNVPNLHLLNFMNDETIFNIQNNYHTQSPILLYSVKSSQIIFDGNQFESNIGLHGGAINIDNYLFPIEEDENIESPLILLKNNVFNKNMAYFEGNSVFIQGEDHEIDSYTEASSRQRLFINLEIDNCTFSNNYGSNTANGGAVSIIGFQDMNNLIQNPFEGDSDFDITKILLNEQYVDQSESESSSNFEQTNNIFFGDIDEDDVEDEEDQEDFAGLIEIIYGINNDISYTFTKGEIKIIDSQFLNNHAGHKGAAINIYNISNGAIIFDNLIIKGNTPAYSLYEEEDLTPFYNLLTMKQYKLNYFYDSSLSQELCSNEISSIGTTECLSGTVASIVNDELTTRIQENYIIYPTMKGSVYLSRLGYIQIKNSTFTENDVGPIFDNNQKNGITDITEMIEESPYVYHYYLKVYRATGVMVEGFIQYIQISNSTFSQQTNSQIKSFVQQYNNELYFYFPQFYFESSHAPLLNFYVNINKNIRINRYFGTSLVDIRQNTFKDQANTQILAYKMSQLHDEPLYGYYGSIIEMFTCQKDMVLNFTNNLVFNQVFRGPRTQLIYHSHKGVINLNYNIFIDIGYISYIDEIDGYQFDNSNTNNKIFHYYDFTEKLSIQQMYSQEVGIFQNSKTIFDLDSQRYYSGGNYFLNCQGLEGAIYKIRSNLYKQIRVETEHNFYQNNGAFYGTILNVHKISSGDTEQEIEIGIIMMTNEVVVQNQYVREVQNEYVHQDKDATISNLYDCISCPDVTDIEYKSLFFTKDFEEDAQRVTIIIHNSEFHNNSPQIFYPQSGSLYLNNCVISMKGFTETMQSEIDDKYKIYERLEQFNYTLEKHSLPNNLFLDKVAMFVENVLENFLEQGSFMIRMENTGSKWMNSYVDNEYTDIDRETLSIGEKEGLEQVFDGFLIGWDAYFWDIDDAEDKKDASQILYTTFSDIQYEDNIEFIIHLEDSKALISDCTFTNLNTNGFYQYQADLTIVNSEIYDIGSKIPFFENDTHNGDFETLKQTIISESEPIIRDDITAYCLMEVYGGILAIQDVNFERIATKNGIFQFSNEARLDVLFNTNFDDIIGIETVSIGASYANPGWGVLFWEVTIKNTISNNGFIEIYFADLYIWTCIFENNYSQYQTNGITAVQSSVQVDDSEISNEMNNQNIPQEIIQDQQTGFINANYLSELEITFSTFSGFQAQIAVLSAEFQSKVDISHTDFINCTGQISMISVDNPEYLEIYKVSITNSSKIQIMNSNPGYFYINNCDFYSSKYKILELSNSQGSIFDSDFFGDNNHTLESSAITISLNSIIEINGNNFHNLNTINNGGAIFLEDADSITIKNNKFSNNSAQMGGAIDILQVDQLEITNNLFESNKAQQSNSTDPKNRHTLAQLKYMLRGGAIYLRCSKTDSRNCNIEFYEQNIFKMNYAEYHGGAISVLDEGFIDEGDGLVFEGNIAGLHSPDVSTYAMQTELDDLENEQYFIESIEHSWDKWVEFYEELIGTDVLHRNIIQEVQIHDSIMRVTLDQVNIMNEYFSLEKYEVGYFPSGQSINITGKLYDTKSIVMSHMNGSVAQLNLYSIKEYQQKVLGNQYVASSVVEQSHLDYEEFSPFQQNNEVIIINGSFIFDQYILMQHPGQATIIELDITNFEQNNQERDFVSNPLVILMLSRQCRTGESLTGDGQCLLCPFGTYLIDAPQTETPCKTCMQNAICYGSNIVYPRDGFSRLNETSEIIIPCLNQDSCLVGDIDHPLGNCKEGYEGFMCGSCAYMYIIGSQHTCIQCPHTAQNVIFSIIRFIFTLLQLYFMSWVNFKIIETNGREVKNYMTSIKILFNHNAVLYAINLITFNWAAIIQNILVAEVFIINSASNLINYNCIFHNNGLNVSERTEKLIISYILVNNVVFSIIILACCKRSFNAIKDKGINVLIFTLWAIYPDMCHQIFAIFSCKNMGEEGDQQRLFSDLDVECWKGIHLVNVLAYGSPAIIIWVIGFPLLLFYFAYKNRDHYYQFCNGTEDLTKQHQYLIIGQMKRYGFLYFGYQDDLYYWEIMIMIKKAVIIFTVQFYTSISEEISCLICFFIIIICIIIMLFFQPYKYTEYNKQIIISEMVMLIRLYFGMFYIAGHDQPYMQGEIINILILMLIVGPSVYFYYVWVQKCFIQLLIIVYQKDLRWFRILTCNLMNQSDFYQNHIVNFEQSQEKVDLFIGDQNWSVQRRDVQKKCSHLDHIESKNEHDQNGEDDYDLFDHQHLIREDLLQLFDKYAKKQNDCQGKKLRQILKVFNPLVLSFAKDEDLINKQNLQIQQLRKKVYFKELGIETIDEDVADAEEAQQEILKLSQINLDQADIQTYREQQPVIQPNEFQAYEAMRKSVQQNYFDIRKSQEKDNITKKSNQFLQNLYEKQKQVQEHKCKINKGLGSYLFDQVQNHSIENSECLDQLKRNNSQESFKSKISQHFEILKRSKTDNPHQNSHSQEQRETYTSRSIIDDKQVDKEQIINEIIIDDSKFSQKIIKKQREIQTLKLKTERKQKEYERNAQHQKKIVEGVKKRKSVGKRVSLQPGQNPFQQQLVANLNQGLLLNLQNQQTSQLYNEAKTQRKPRYNVSRYDDDEEEDNDKYGLGMIKTKDEDIVYHPDKGIYRSQSPKPRTKPPRSISQLLIKKDLEKAKGLNQYKMEIMVEKVNATFDAIEKSKGPHHHNEKPKRRRPKNQRKSRFESKSRSPTPSRSRSKNRR